MHDSTLFLRPKRSKSQPKAATSSATKGNRWGSVVCLILTAQCCMIWCKSLFSELRGQASFALTKIKTLACLKYWACDYQQRETWWSRVFVVQSKDLGSGGGGDCFLPMRCENSKFECINSSRSVRRSSVDEQWVWEAMRNWAWFCKQFILKMIKEFKFEKSRSDLFVGQSQATKRNSVKCGCW